MPVLLYHETEPNVSRSILNASLPNDYTFFHVDSVIDFLTSLNTLKPKICIIDLDAPDQSTHVLLEAIFSLKSKVILIYQGLMHLEESLLVNNPFIKTFFFKKTLIVEEFLQNLTTLYQPEKISNDAEHNSDIRFGSCLFNTASRTLSTSKIAFRLTNKEAQLLVLLLKYKGGILPRVEALSSVWNRIDAYTSRSMDVILSSLKKKLSAEKEILIKNHRGLGHSLTIVDYC
ncbi:helix-turn-helix domain-containing protein [Pedobacter aquatilis]|uniref:winged helix-turn-helix domain-containing protein n=1 Tax=Pedobacter aquatilis TaxID=351343 RepID=UPI00292E9146|nr:winged helix-turn-helix domain-containing protein [Pedobacter aquatilis]